MRNMLPIAKLFGRSPIAPLQGHMNKVIICINTLAKLFYSTKTASDTEISTLFQEVSLHEYEADLAKEDIRNNLPYTLFMPFSREHFLAILRNQDAIANLAEEIGFLIQAVQQDQSFFDKLTPLFSNGLESCIIAHTIIEDLEALLNASFGGAEAVKIKTLSEQISKKEYQTTLLKRELLTELFQHSETLTAPMFYHKMSLTKSIGQLPKQAERLANQIRIILQTK